MPNSVEVIAVEETASDIGGYLDRADERPLVLKRNGHRYRLFREDEAVYEDIEARRAILREFAGFLSDEEAAEMKEYLRRGREEGSRPIDDSAVSG